MKTNMKIISASLILAALSAATMFGGCRPAHNNSGSGTNDFGALASGMTMARQNYAQGGCGFQRGGVATDANDEMDRAQGALPSGLRHAFQQWDVRFRLSDNIAEECSQSLQNATSNMRVGSQSSELRNYVRACVVERASGSGGNRGFDIVVKSDAESIHNWLLVESFAVFYYLADRAESGLGADQHTSPQIGNDLTAIRQQKADISATFLGELSTSNPQVVQRYASMFRTSGNRLAQHPKFQALVMTELSDSYFCNQRTRAQNTFPNTRQRFETFAQQYLR